MHTRTTTTPPRAFHATAAWLHACRPWLAEPDRVALARLTDAGAPPTATEARRLAEIAARVETRCTEGAQ